METAQDEDLRIFQRVRARMLKPAWGAKILGGTLLNTKMPEGLVPLGGGANGAVLRDLFRIYGGPGWTLALSIEVELG